MDCSTNVRALLMNEISLEGLDGITFQALWLRIAEETKTKLPFPEAFEIDYWDIIRRIEDFSFYELEEPRADLVLYDRFAYIDNDGDNSYYEPDDVPSDLYAHQTINDTVNGIRGSCPTYYTRKDVTKEARNLEYKEAKKRWGSKLVIVASQECRENALMGTQNCHNVELSAIQFCVLERIGRSRYQGEITQGKRSLQIFGEDPKSLFYHRKSLLKHKLITKQIYHQKSNGQNVSGTLLHLQRYYAERKSKPLLLTEQVVEMLRNKPNFRAQYAEVTTKLCLSCTTKKLFKSPEFQRFVKTDVKIPYREFYPSAPTSQWKHKNMDKEKSIRVMQLIDPDIDVAEHWSQLDDVEEEDEESGYQNYENLYFGVPLLSQAAAIVREHGGNGCCQSELGEIMGQSKLNARSFCRNLLRRNVVTCVMNDVGRQRVTRFVARKFERKGQMTLQFRQERDKMMSLLSTIDNNSTIDNDFEDPPLEQDDLEKTDNEKQTEIVAEKNSIESSEFASVFIKEELSSTINENTDNCDIQSVSETDLSLQTNLEGSVSSSSVLDSIDNESESNVLNQQSNKSISNESEKESVEPPAKKQKLSVEENKKKRKRIKQESMDQFPSKKLKMETSIPGKNKKSCENITVKMVVAKAMPGLKGYSQGLNEQLKNVMSNSTYCDGSRLTYRILKRANFIIESVRQEKVIPDLTKLIKMIQEEENDEGYNVKIDKKSLIRLLLKLAKDGYLKYIKATLSNGKKEKYVYFVCDPSISESHSVIQSALEQAKMKFDTSVMNTTEPEPTNDNASLFNIEPINNELSTITTSDKMEYPYERKAARNYGFCPKFVRMRIIHELLFYLIYDPPGESISEPDDLKQLLKDLNQPCDEQLVQEMSPVYYFNEINWKMFIPPIPIHLGWPRGWTLICDILLRLPLSLFMKCFHVPYQIDDLDYYLSHPIRKYYLVKHLPVKIRNGLMFKRKYIFGMHEIISRLCYIGLVQFGAQRLKEKDQVFIYLNRRTSLLNTTLSQPGYHETSIMDYEKHTFYFDNLIDIEQYWYELWTTCMNTKLGGRLCVTGKYIVLEQLHTKESMLKAVLPRMPEEAPEKDNGEVPGDKRGAAGLDSAIFAHLKRNWNWQTNDELFGYPTKPAQKKEKTIKIYNPNDPNDVTELPIKKHIVSGTVKHLNKTRKNTTPPKSDDRPKKYRVNSKLIVRKVLPKRCKKRKPFYDEIDKQALKQMAKLRTDWSPIEDHVLLLCTVGSKYLCPNRHRQIVSFSVIRDVLHKIVPTSVCKTSRACQRRILYIMKNINTRRSVNMCLEEIRQNTNITEKYNNIYKLAQQAHVPESELNIAFVELVAFMSKMFSNLIKPEKKKIYVIPSNIKEFKETFHISRTNRKIAGYFKEPQNVHDINFNVIKTVIHSSMCCTKDKTSWAYQLFKVYQQYPESLLRNVITRTRHEQMISLKKSFIKAHKTGHVMPLSSSPYQLSISYKYQLLSKYPNTLFQEAYDMLKTTAAWVNQAKITESDKNQGLEVLNPRAGTATAVTELIEKVNVKFRFDIPEEVIVLDQKIENDQTYERIITRYYNLLKNPASLEEKMKTKTDSDDEDNFPTFESDELPKKSIDNSLPRPTTRIAFYMMRAEMCEGLDDKSIQHMHDFFVVNTSKVFLNLPTLIETRDNFTPEYLCEDYFSIKCSITAEILASIKNDALVPNECATESELTEYMVSLRGNVADLKLARKIVDFVLEKDVIGATIADIKPLLPEYNRGNLDIMEILEILTDLKILLRTGIEKVRYVHFEHKKPWIIYSYKILRLDREKMVAATSSTKDTMAQKLFRHKKKFSYIELQKSKQRLDLTSQQQIKVLMTPWIRIDGSVNRRVLDRWMECVLTACLDSPGITMEVLSHKFIFMKPVDILTLVKYLTKLKCIQQTVIIKPKVTIFSDVPTMTLVPATGTEDLKDIFIEPYCDAVTKLAMFIGEKAYSTDFLM